MDDEIMQKMYEQYKSDVPESTETFEEFKEQTNQIFAILDANKDEIIETIRSVVSDSINPKINLSKWSS
jgi:uncharacterized protein YaaN involved in tellurite resistance